MHAPVYGSLEWEAVGEFAFGATITLLVFVAWTRMFGLSEIGLTIATGIVVLLGVFLGRLHRGSLAYSAARR